MPPSPLSDFNSKNAKGTSHKTHSAPKTPYVATAEKRRFFCAEEGFPLAGEVSADGLSFRGAEERALEERPVEKRSAAEEGFPLAEIELLGGVTPVFSKGFWGLRKIPPLF